MTDSSTGGFIKPSAAQIPTATPLEDAALDTFLQVMVVGITGIPGDLVWPRWQESPPNLPGNTINWASIGVQDMDGDTFAYEAHNPVIPANPFPPLPIPEPDAPANGYDILIRHETLTILCSFYGPNARANSSVLRDGLSVPQNREYLQLAGMGLVETGKIIAVPSIVNNKWYRRFDIPLVIRRQIVRNYPILNIASSEITVETDQNFNININIINS